MRTFLKISFFLLISIFLVSFSVYYTTEHDWETSPTQAIKSGVLVSKYPDFSFNFSSFALKLNQKSGNLQIFSLNSQIFANNPGSSFLYCATGQATSQNHFGMWDFQDKYTQICKDQVIDEISQISSVSIEIKGYFSDCTADDRFHIIFEEKDQKIQVSSQCLSPLFNRTIFVMKSHEKESVFGFGEHSGDVNMKGKILSNFAREPGMFRDGGFLNFLADLVANRTGGKPYYSYYPAPLFLTTELRGVYLINDNYNIFDMTDPQEIKLMVWNPKISFILFDDSNFPKLIGKLTELTGRMKPLPDWIMNGAVVAITGGSEKLRTAYDQLTKFNTSISGIWTQDWSGKRFDGTAMRLWWNWQIDRDLYPEWDNFTAELRRNGVRRMTYINPMLHNISGYLNKSTNFFEIAARNNYLLRDSNGNILYYELSGFRAGMLDFTNPAAYDFYKGIVKDYMFNDSQTSGFMADFGEDPPIDNIVYNDSSYSENDAIHNR